MTCPGHARFSGLSTDHFATRPSVRPGALLRVPIASPWVALARMRSLRWDVVALRVPHLSPTEPPRLYLATLCLARVAPCWRGHTAVLRERGPLRAGRHRTRQSAHSAGRHLVSAAKLFCLAMRIATARTSVTYCSIKYYVVQLYFQVCSTT